MSTVADLMDLLRESKRDHHVNEEESYYSCAALQPKASRIFGPCTCDASEWNARVDAALSTLEMPLLICADCHNTESCAGAMARMFNHGRCAHCGGLFKVVRA